VAQGTCGEEASLVQLRQQQEQPARTAPAAARHAVERVRQEMMAERESRRAGAPRAAPHDSCTLGGRRGCPLSGMHGKTLVYPRGKTSCLNGDPFAFFVTPGASDKLVFYLQGGGACWSQLTFDIQACQQSLEEARSDSGTLRGQGIFDVADRRNSLRGYTIVEVLYCSGDAFVGDTVQNWSGTNPQVGYRNALSALDWVMQNTRTKLSSLVLMGASGGALGTQAWADYLLSKGLRYDKAAVLADSYAGVLPVGTMAPTLQAFGSCALPIWTRAEQVLCKAGRLTVRRVMRRTISRHRGVPFGFLQAKADAVQRNFFNLLALTYNSFDPMISGPDFYYKTNALFARYNKYPNFVVMYVDGEAHIFTETDVYYTAGTRGAASGSEKGQPLMYQWVNRLVSGGGCPSSQCAGRLSASNRDSIEYCDENLFPKACAASY